MEHLAGLWRNKLYALAVLQVWNATKWNDELTGRPNYELDTLQGHENDVNYVQFRFVGRYSFSSSYHRFTLLRLWHVLYASCFKANTGT